MFYGHLKGLGASRHAGSRTSIWWAFGESQTPSNCLSSDLAFESISRVRVLNNARSLKFVRNECGLYVQYAALPMRVVNGDELEILLITSRRTRRWVIPKGWPIPDMDGPLTAAVEAYEEAGIKGDLLPQPIGSYRYGKHMGAGGDDVPCEVTVFPMRSVTQSKDWPERSKRRLQWFARTQAASQVEEEELADLIVNIPISIA